MKNKPKKSKKQLQKKTNKKFYSFLAKGDEESFGMLEALSFLYSKKEDAKREMEEYKKTFSETDDDGNVWYVPEAQIVEVVVRSIK
jgi:hypothetical protein